MPKKRKSFKFFIVFLWYTLHILILWIFNLLLRIYHPATVYDKLAKWFSVSCNKQPINKRCVLASRPSHFNYLFSHRLDRYTAVRVGTGVVRNHLYTSCGQDSVSHALIIKIKSRINRSPLSLTSQYNI